MLKVIKIVLILSTLVYAKDSYKKDISSLGVVNTHTLSIREKASVESKIITYVKEGARLPIIKLVLGSDNRKWIKTTKGYVKAKYITQKYKPKGGLVVDYSKYAIQLVSYFGGKKHLHMTKQKLPNEKNLFIKKISDKVYVVYLVNFNSKKEAQQKQQDIKHIFPDTLVRLIPYKKTKISHTAKPRVIKKTNKKPNRTSNIDDLVEKSLILDI
jgi:hypothetical protein